MSAMKSDYFEGGDKANHCDYQDIYHCDCTIVEICDEYQTVGFETGRVTQRTHASVEKEDQNNCHQYIFLVVFMMVKTLITMMYVIFLFHNHSGDESADYPTQCRGLLAPGLCGLL